MWRVFVKKLGLGPLAFCVHLCLRKFSEVKIAMTPTLLFILLALHGKPAAVPAAGRISLDEVTLRVMYEPEDVPLAVTDTQRWLETVYLPQIAADIGAEIEERRGYRRLLRALPSTT